MKIISLVLLELFVSAVKGQVKSFGLKAGQLPSSGSDVILQCTAFDKASSISIYSVTTSTFLSICSPGESKCIPESTGRYNYSRTDASVYINIKNLQRDLDEKKWICQAANLPKEFYLTVYTIPTSISLIGPDTCDLTASQCGYICKTGGCTYPTPELVFLYSQNNGNATKRMFGSYEQHSTEKQDSCSRQEKIYSRTIQFPRYSTSPDIARKTIKLQCMIQFPNVTNKLRSDFSGNVQFAVMVSNVTIFYRERVLKDGDRLTVRESQEETLRCKPGYGRPLPSVKWYIGEKLKSTGESFSFVPTNSIHNKNVYCKAYNIPPRELESVKVALYVKVKIKNVYLEPAMDTSLSVIENITEPVVCITSGGRPGAIIKWLKFNSGQDLGPSDFIEHKITNENLNITKATKNVMVLRQDKGWILVCEAWNTDKDETVKANNSKSFNVLYSPEKMRISYSEKNVIGSVIDVVRGSNVSLKCTADGNPQVQSYSWRRHAHYSLGEILTIENIRNNETVQCTANNSMESSAGHIKEGSGSITKEINVLYEAEITTFTVLSVDIVENEDSFTVNENAFLPIVCDVDSNPGSYINLKQSHKLISKRQNSRTLDYNISSANCSHNSEYTCEAWNKINTEARAAERKIQINVRCAPMLAEGTDSTVFALQNRSTVLSVTVIAFPKPTHYSWFKNTSSGWQEMINSSDIRITRTSLQFNLTFRKVRKEDYGEYNLTVDNGIGYPSSFLLLLQAKEKAEPLADNGSVAGIIGGVVGGLLVAGMIIAVWCILRRRNSFDGMKVFLFGSKSTASRGDMDPVGQSTQDGEYSYALLDKLKGQKEINSIGNSNAPVVATKQDEGPCYENPVMSDDSYMKDNPPKKAKTTKTSGKKKPTQGHEGLVYIDIHFEDKKTNANQKKKQMAAAKPKVNEGVVYDAVQFGAIGEPYREEKKSE